MTDTKYTQICGTCGCVIKLSPYPLQIQAVCGNCRTQWQVQWQPVFVKKTTESLDCFVR